MNNLKELVDSIKNLIKNEAESKISLIDVDGNEILFEAVTVEDIVEGVKAEPDGEYIFNDGLKVVISNGVVTSIEKITEGKPAEEVVVESPNDVTEEVVEKTVEEVVEQPNEKDVLIEQLKRQIEELKKALEEAMTKESEKVKEVEEITRDLEEIKNFYTKVSIQNNRVEEPTKTIEHKSEGFSFKRKK